MSNTTPRDTIFIKGGIYNPTRRFEFTNVTDKPFTFKWNNIPATIKPGEKVVLRHHLAVLATTQLVDQIMMEEIKVEEDKMKIETRNPYYRSPHGGKLGIPAVRETYENRILKELPAKDDNDATLQIERQQLIDGLTRDLNSEVSPPISKASEIGIKSQVEAIKEFEDINLPSR